MMKLRTVGPSVSNSRAEVFDIGGRQFAVIRTASPYSVQAVSDLSQVIGMPVVCLADGESLEVVESEADRLLEVERKFNVSLAEKCDQLEKEAEKYKKMTVCGCGKKMGTRHVCRTCDNDE